MYDYMYIYTYVMGVATTNEEYMYVCLYVCMYMYVYIYIYVYTEQLVDRLSHCPSARPLRPPVCLSSVRPRVRLFVFPPV